jgi:hypothetical protein
MTVLDATPPENVEQRDLYDRAPELLRSWANGNVVLIGDGELLLRNEQGFAATMVDTVLSF